MKRILFALLFALVFATALPILAQDATVEPAATQEVTAGEAPVTVVTGDEVTTVYVEVMPAWVLPGYAVLLVVIGFLLMMVYKYGVHLKDMISEKAFAGLLNIVRDVAKDIAARTENKIDDALVKLIPDEAATVTTTTTTTMLPAAPETVPGVG
jgi:hypothetical protein